MVAWANATVGSRTRASTRGEKASLRKSPKQYMQTIVEHFNLNRWLGQEEARALLVQAGYRGQAPYVTFLFFRAVMPVDMLAISAFYVCIVLELDQPNTVKIASAWLRQPWYQATEPVHKT
jgi:tight adherence protein C